jgi:hypothetical protein
MDNEEESGIFNIPERFIPPEAVINGPEAAAIAFAISGLAATFFVAGILWGEKHNTMWAISGLLFIVASIVRVVDLVL